MTLTNTQVVEILQNYQKQIMQLMADNEAKDKEIAKLKGKENPSL